jgi:hypothetical protein
VVGVGGFILLGYLIGFLVAGVTLFDMHSSPKGAWRTTGRRRRTWETIVGLSWLVLGWGAVLAAIVWFAGEARNQIRQAAIDHEAEREIDLELEDRKAEIARERETIDLREITAERD